MKIYTSMAVLAMGFFIFTSVHAADAVELKPVSESPLSSYFEEYDMKETIKVTGPKSGTTMTAGKKVTVTWDKKTVNGDKVYIAVQLMGEKYMGEDVIAPVEYGIPNSGTHTIEVEKEYMLPTGTYKFIVYTETAYGYSQEIKFKGTVTYDEIVKEAQEKGMNAAAKARLANARAEAELYYDQNSSYKGVCSSADGIRNQLADAEDATGYKVDCDDTTSAWAAEVKLKSSEGYYCVDSTGSFVAQKKSKGKNATSCSGKKAGTSDVALKIKSASGLKKTYKPGMEISFTTKLTQGKKKVTEEDYSVYAYLVRTGGGNTETAWSSYDEKRGTWKFHVAAPTTAGEYRFEIGAYCKTSACVNVQYSDRVVLSKPIKVTETTAKSESSIRLLTPNGGEVFGNPGSINVSWTWPTDKGYQVSLYAIPSKDTVYESYVDVSNKVPRSYSLGGSGSAVPSTATYYTTMGMSYLPDGKYKLRAYLYPSSDAWNNDPAQAVGMDESDGYFTIDTANSNRY